MTVFYYRARGADGSPIQGSMEAETVDQVLANLRTRPLFVTDVERAKGRLRPLGIPRISRAPDGTAMLAFYRSFAMLVRSGVSIRRALIITIDRCEDRRLREALSAVLSDVETGSSLSVALGRHPKEFAALQIAMIGAGEVGGVLDDVLERVATLLEKDRGLRKKIQSALAYPSVVLAASVALIVFLMAKIVPMFADMFATFHAELPAPTQALIRVGMALSQPSIWLAASIAIMAAAVGLRFAERTRAGALWLDDIRLHVPIMGGLVRKGATARIARMLGCLLRSGVTLLHAIDVTIPVTNSRKFGAALQSVHAALGEGDSLSNPLKATRLFDPLFVALVGVGEETGTVDEMMLKVADYFDADIDTAIATLGAVVEPLLIVFLGGVVGLIVLAIFLPLYSLIGSVNR